MHGEGGGWLWAKDVVVGFQVVLWKLGGGIWAMWEKWQCDVVERRYLGGVVDDREWNSSSTWSEWKGCVRRGEQGCVIVVHEGSTHVMCNIKPGYHSKDLNEVVNVCIYWHVEGGMSMMAAYGVAGIIGRGVGHPMKRVRISSTVIWRSGKVSSTRSIRLER